MRITKRVKVGVLGAVVSLVALFFIVQQVDIDLFIMALTTADYGYLLPCLVLLIIGLVTRAVRWYILLAGRLPLVRTFSIMNIAYLVNGILPLRIGEIARVYLVSRTRTPLPIPHTTSTIIVERLLDLLAIVLMVLFALVLGPVPPALHSAAIFAAGAVVVGFGGLVLLASQRSFAERLFAALIERVPLLHRFDVLEDWFAQFLDGLAPLTNLRSAVLAICWTAISWGFSVMAGYVLMFAFFAEASIAVTMLYIAAAAFVIAVPAVPGNVGSYELSILLALGAYGYDETGTGLAFAVMVHAVNVFVHAGTGVIGFIQEGITWTQLSEGVQQMQRTKEIG